MDCVFGAVFKKPSPYPRLSNFALVLSYRTFIVLCFTFNSMIHFELNFVKGIRAVSKLIFFFLQVGVQLFQHHFSKRLSFALFCLSTLDKQQLTVFMWLSSGLCMLFHWFTCSFANTTLAWLLCLYKSLKSGGVCSPELFLNIVIGLPW